MDPDCIDQRDDTIIHLNTCVVMGDAGFHFRLDTLPDNGNQVCCGYRVCMPRVFFAPGECTPARRAMVREVLEQAVNFDNNWYGEMPIELVEYLYDGDTIASIAWKYDNDHEDHEVVGWIADQLRDMA